MARHIVHKQKLNVQVSKPENAHLFQSAVSRLMQQGLPVKMETLFDELAPGEQIIRIEKLSLDLKTIPSENFEKEFEEKFLAQLKTEITKLKTNTNENELIQTIKPESLFNSLIYFLQHGYLAWYNTVKQIKFWEEEMVQHFSVQEWKRFLEWFRKNYIVQPQIHDRLILQFSDNFLMDLIAGTELCTRSVSNDVYTDLNYLLNIFPQKVKTQSRLILWKAVLFVLMKNEKNEIAELFALKDVLKTIDNNGHLFFLKETELLKDIKTSPVQKVYLKIIALLKESKTPDEKPESFDLLNEQALTAEEKSQKRPAITEDGLYVENCGIILLHPFLEIFLEELKLISGKQFINEHAQKRSVLLLHYLATGSAETEEFNLVLQKIICGLHLEESLPPFIELNEKEITESENLLSSVMNYWAPLKNTSPAGLRNSFLQRGGKLSLTENGWLLNVEQKTIDILLGKLPWGFSTIRLPWMKDLLSVEWY